MRKLTTLLLLTLVALYGSAQESKTNNEWVNTLVDRITFTGYAHAGFEYYDQSEPKDQFKVARIIIMANAQVFDNMNVYGMFDFKSSTLHELWANYKFNKAINVKVGQFKTPFTIENPLSPTVLELIYPSSLATGYMIGGSNSVMMKSAAGRDLGATVYGSFLNGLFDYNLAIMNGSGRNNADNNSQKDFVARLTVNPISCLSVSGSMIKGTGNLAVTPVGDGTFVSSAAAIKGIKHNGNYRRDRYAMGLQLKTSPVNLRTEYMIGKDGDSDSKGYYATGTVNNLGINHLDLVASYDWLDIYSGKTTRYSGGLQYWFYPRCRVQLGYGYTKSDGKHDENCILAQLQVRF